MQGVSTVCASVVLCHKTSENMGLIFGRVVNWATTNLQRDFQPHFHDLTGFVSFTLL